MICTACPIWLISVSGDPNRRMCDGCPFVPFAVFGIIPLALARRGVVEWEKRKTQVGAPP